MENHKGLTIDVIIAKFVPIIGTVLFTIGLGYLIYTSVWQGLPETMRLVVGFFTSVMIIGGAFSFSERLKYFADVIMGGGILLLYGTLIYGSRTVDIATQTTIPEVATLFTAFFFTLAVAYFASLRKSKVILAMAMIGAYITPFVIGTNGDWGHSMSYNAYLTYFAAVNFAIFALGREIATHDLIPLNLLGLFFGTTTLHALSYSGALATAHDTFFGSEDFTAILLGVLTAISVASIALSSRYFTEIKEEIMLSIGYLFPLAWLVIHLERLTHMTILVHGNVQLMHVLALVLVMVTYFVTWALLRPLHERRYQHVALYVGGILSLVFIRIAAFPEPTVYSHIIAAYISFIFLALYIFDTKELKPERIMTAILFSAFGGLMALAKIYGPSSDAVEFKTTLAVIALVPAMIVYPIAYLQKNTPGSILKLSMFYSASAVLTAGLIIFFKIIDFFDTGFVLFVLPGFLLVLRSYFQASTDKTRGTVMRAGTLWLSIGFFLSFFHFLSFLIPHQGDGIYFFKDGAILSNVHFFKGLFAIATYFLALSVSRDIQKVEKVDRPSFLLVIVGYASLLLVVNFMIITICNDIGVDITSGGPRAIGTTIWWVILSIVMIMIGVHHGRVYRSEKLLGLMLLFLTIGKIGFYDLAYMDTNKKIIVLMMAGGLMMVFSYFLQAKGYLKEEGKE